MKIGRIAACLTVSLTLRRAFAPEAKGWAAGTDLCSGTGWANTEYRTYRFPDPRDENASLEETSKSRERRRGTEKPLSKTEQMELRQTTHKNWERDGFQVQSKA